MPRAQATLSPSDCCAQPPETMLFCAFSPRVNCTAAMYRARTSSFKVKYCADIPLFSQFCTNT